MITFLKDEQYYVDLYDLITIRDCLGTIEFFSKPLKATSELEKKMSPKEVKRGKMLVTDIAIYYKKGERYKYKAERIREWMERDKVRDEFLNSAVEPKNIQCPNCTTKMVSTTRDLDKLENKKMRVIFFFECPDCNKRKGIFDNGEEFKSSLKICPECRRELNYSYKKEGHKVTRIRNCSSCSFSETEVDDYDAQDAEWKKQKDADKQLLKNFRNQFCMSDKEGQDYISSALQTERLMSMLKEKEVKEANPAYQKAMQLKKLRIVELEKLLFEVLEKEKYMKLSFDKPEMGKYVIIPFTVQEADAKRSDYDSVHILKKLIENALVTTNWRLMSEGIYYRLGILTGKLKAYEGEEDLIKIV